MRVFIPPTARGYSEALPMPSGYFSLILRGPDLGPRAAESLLDGTNVTEQTLASGVDITLGQQLRLVRNAARVLGPDWALDAGTRLSSITHGPLSLGAVCAPTLRDGLGVMRTYSYLRAPHTQLHLVPAGKEVRLVLEDRVALCPMESRALLELVMQSNQALIEAQLGRPMVEGRFEFPYPEPEHASVYRTLLHAPVRFGCPEAAIVIPATWLAAESPFANREVYHGALAELDASARRLHGDRLLLARVEKLLADRGEPLGIHHAARLLGVSNRTLNRRLAAQGTSFHALVDENRKSRAVALLQDPTLSATEIAFLLGYEDAANFGRAFRRWFGISPGRYRRLVEPAEDPEDAAD